MFTIKYGRRAGHIPPPLIACVILLGCLFFANSARSEQSDDSRQACGWTDGVFVHGRRDRQEVALSFDACPTTLQPPFSESIARTLTSEGVPSTVFVSGLWAAKNPSYLVQLTTIPGVEIALHGHRHRHLIGQATMVTDEEIRLGQQTLRRLNLQPSALFRPPFGDAPKWLAERAQQEKVTPVLWEVVTGDPDPHISARRIERTVLKEARPGSIIIMHINGGGVHTAEALPGVIAGLRQRGLQFVTVGQMLRNCGAP